MSGREWEMIIATPPTSYASGPSHVIVPENYAMHNITMVNAGT